jgi:hypothetical protein
MRQRSVLCAFSMTCLAASGCTGSSTDETVGSPDLRSAPPGRPLERRVAALSDKPIAASARRTLDFPQIGCVCEDPPNERN